jgi:hypothetical protein
VSRIVLIHALPQSVVPIEAAFAALWGEAERVNLLDDSLALDRARAAGLTPPIAARILALARYGAEIGAAGLLFTCSAFGPAIEAAARALAPLPVLKPNEAMIEEALRAARAEGGAVGLIATFAPTLETLPAEFAAVDGKVPVLPALAEGALEALARGEGAEHDARIAETAARLAPHCAVIALAQFSAARAADAARAASGRPVFTTPEWAVRRMRQRVEGGDGCASPK